MERQEGIQIGIDKPTYHNGIKIEAYKIEDSSKGASDTALHEAKHVVAGIDDGANIEVVSVVPGPGYLGITRFNRFTDAGAAAPDADGHNGTGWDTHLIEKHGGNLMSARVRGKSSILRRPKHVLKVARELDRRGTLNGSEVMQIYRELEEGEEIRIDITDIDGNKKTFTTHTNENNVYISAPQLPKSS